MLSACCKIKRRKYVEDFRASPSNGQANVGNVSETLKAKVDEFRNKTETPFNLNLFNKYRLHDCVFPGSSNTKFDTLVMSMALIIRHGLSGVASEDALKMINTILGGDVVPDTKFKIKNLFAHNAQVEYHYYCHNCKAYVGTEKECEKIEVCPNKENCKESFSLKGKNKGCYFVTLPIASQIIKLLEEPGMSEKLIDIGKREKNEGYLSDIFDGLMYKGYLKSGLIKPGETLTITVNSDGSPIFKACKNSLWPIQFRLNELIPRERFAPNRVLLAGLWFGNSEPEMATFFVPFIKAAKELAEEGISWVDSKSGSRKFAKVLTICCIADSCAKPMLQNIKKFSGYFGCGYCYHPGKSVGKNMKYPAKSHRERSNEECRKAMVEAERIRKDVKGIKGYSAFFPLEYFKFPWGFPIDPMHNSFIGVTKFLFDLWFSTGNPYSLSAQAKADIDKRLLNIRPPSNITRPPRSIFDCVHWKANEWRSFLFYYSYICFDGIMEEEYLEHFSLFCSAIYILYKEKVSEEEVRRADKMLQEFVLKFETLYGTVNMRYNVHILTHLARNVAVWGPLWTTSLFDFEGKQGSLVELCHGTRCVVEQIAIKCTIHSNISSIIYGHNLVNPDVADYCEKLLSFRRLKNFSDCDQATLVGSYTVTIPTNEQARALRSYGISDFEFLSGWNKIIFKGSVFNSDTGSTLHNDSLAKLKNNEHEQYFKIFLFFINPSKPNELLFFGRPLLFCDEEGSVRHIKECRLNAFGALSVLRVKDIVCKSVLMKVDFTHYVCDIPNIFEKD